MVHWSNFLQVICYVPLFYFHNKPVWQVRLRVQGWGWPKVILSFVADHMYKLTSAWSTLLWQQHHTDFNDFTYISAQLTPVSFVPFRSLSLATKWCANLKWIHRDTRPFASLTRDVATALGLGVALHSSCYRNLKWDKLSQSQRVWCASLATLVLNVLSNAVQPENLALWYGLTFVKYATFPWLVVALLPRVVYAVSSKKTSPHQE